MFIDLHDDLLGFIVITKEQYIDVSEFLDYLSLGLNVIFVSEFNQESDLVILFVYLFDIV